MAAVSLGDIAAEVGLGRTSLYRYFPTKAHILQRWFDLEMEPLVERSLAVVAGSGPATDRLRAWLDVQLDFMTDSAHVVLMGGQCCRRRSCRPRCWRTSAPGTASCTPRSTASSARGAPRTTEQRRTERC